MRISKFLYPPSIARCQHLKVNGVQCGSPSLKNRKLCHFHQRWQQGRIQLNANRSRRSRYSLDLPILEDANSIQVALMQGMRLLLTNQVDHRTAALLFYALQTASSNLSRTTFEPRPQQVVIDPSSIPDTSLGDDAWYKEEFTNDNDEDDQEATETNNEPVAASAGVNIQAIADCDHVAPRLREAVSWAVTSGLVTASAKFVRTKPGEMMVTRCLSPRGRNFLPTVSSQSSGSLLAREEDVGHFERSVPGKAHPEFHCAELPGQEEGRQVV